MTDVTNEVNEMIQKIINGKTLFNTTHSHQQSNKLKSKKQTVSTASTVYTVKKNAIPKISQK